MNTRSVNRGLALFYTYRDKQDDRFKTGLDALRQLVLKAAPGAEETFSYQVHCFKHIYMLAGIGVTKDFCSLYTMSPSLVKKMREELKGYKISGATIHFAPGEPLPAELITRIILARVQENELLAASRRK